MVVVREVLFPTSTQLLLVGPAGAGWSMHLYAYFCFPFLKVSGGSPGWPSTQAFLLSIGIIVMSYHTHFSNHSLLLVCGAFAIVGTGVHVAYHDLPLDM